MRQEPEIYNNLIAHVSGQLLTALESGITPDKREVKHSFETFDKEIVILEVPTFKNDRLGILLITTFYLFVGVILLFILKEGFFNG